MEKRHHVVLWKVVRRPLSVTLATLCAYLEVMCGRRDNVHNGRAEAVDVEEGAFELVPREVKGVLRGSGLAEARYHPGRK